MTVKVYQGARTTAAHTFENVLTGEFLFDGKWLKVIFENKDITFIPLEYVRQVEYKHTEDEINIISADITEPMVKYEKSEAEKVGERLNDSLKFVDI